MNLTTSSLIRSLAAATVIGLAPSIVRAQSRASSVPSFLQPAEGETVTGDLEIKVQAPAGATVRTYTIEVAYWDAAQSRWVYPGTLGPDFGDASTRIASDERTRLGAPATRWRIHLRSSDPPGSWGPWREFTWQAAPPVPEKSVRSASASSPAPASTSVVKGDSPVPVVQDDAVIQQIGSNQAKNADFKAKIAELIAQCDAQIAAVKEAIVLQKLKIAGLQSKITQLEADLIKHEALLNEITKQGPASSEQWPEAKYKEWIEKVVAAIDKVQQDEADIEACEDQIDSCMEKIKDLEDMIVKLEHEKAQLAKSL